MNPRGPLQAIFTAVFLLIILAALIAGAIYAFAVDSGTTQPAPSTTPSSLSTPLPAPGTLPISPVPDQTRITTPIIIMSIIIVAIIIFGITWAWQGRPVRPALKPGAKS